MLQTNSRRHAHRLLLRNSSIASASTSTSTSTPTITGASMYLQRRGVRMTDFSEVAGRRKGKNLVPEEDRGKPVYYNGPETLRVAYVMDRLPKLQTERHAIEYEFQDLWLEKNNQKARHKWTAFPEYYEKWKELKKKQKKPKGVQTKKGPRLEDVIVVPDPPEKTYQERMTSERMMGGRNTMTPYAENWVKTWWPERRYTQADFDDNRYAINRKYMDRLYLIVKDAETGKWKFPDAVRENPFTMRQACQMKFESDMDRRCSGFFVSHTPIAHYQDPNNEMDKTFFYHVLYLAGRPPFKRLANMQGWQDHAWVTKHEALDYEFVDEKYKDITFNMLSEAYDFMTDTDRVTDYSKMVKDFEAQIARKHAAFEEKSKREKHLVEQSEQLRKKAQEEEA